VSRRDVLGSSTMQKDGPKAYKVSSLLSGLMMVLNSESITDSRGHADRA
jgi:hypothetical protein